MDLRNELLTVIEECNLDLRFNIDDRTSLIKSGLFDSRALFDLAVWIQEQIGSRMDFTQFDLAEEWDTVSNILAFIKKHQFALKD